MAILVDNASRVLVHGIAGREGAFHAGRMLAAGTNVVAGVSPGHSCGELEGVPVFDNVREAVAETSADVTVILVAAPHALDALLEAADAGIKLIICIADGVGVRDTAEVMAHLPRRGAELLGPNCPGLTTPRRCSAGIMPPEIFRPGAAGVISRAGTLTYEVIDQLSRAGIGQSTVVGVGGDEVHGIGFIECLELFEADMETEGIALIGEVGGDDEHRAAVFVRDHVTKPVVAYVPRSVAPLGRRGGYAGDTVEDSSSRVAAKIAALEGAGILVAGSPSELARLLGEAVRNSRVSVA